MSYLNTNNAPADFSEYINVDDGIRRTANNVAVYKRVLAAFLYDESYANLLSAAKMSDHSLYVCVHTLKGLTANLSLTKLNQLCADIEDNIKNDEDISDNIALMSRVYDKTVEYINIANSLATTER